METNLQRIIKERGLKQAFIAEKADVSPGALSKIVRGESLPTLPVAIRIARVLGETVEELWGYLVE
jgi:DNA-binding XRE family transcriptional regulator